MLGTAVTQIEGGLLVFLFSLQRNIIFCWAIDPHPLSFVCRQAFLVTHLVVQLPRGRLPLLLLLLLLLLLPLLEHHDVCPCLLPLRFLLCLASSCRLHRFGQIPHSLVPGVTDVEPSLREVHNENFEPSRSIEGIPPAKERLAPLLCQAVPTFGEQVLSPTTLARVDGRPEQRQAGPTLRFVAKLEAFLQHLAIGVGQLRRKELQAAQESFGAHLPSVLTPAEAIELAELGYAMGGSKESSAVHFGTLQQFLPDASARLRARRLQLN